MKSRSPQRAVDAATQAPRQLQQTTQDLGNAAAQEGMDAVGLSQTPTLDALGLPDMPDNPASAAAAALGLDGLQLTEDSVSYDGKGVSVDECIDVSLGCLGPLTVGLKGAFATSLDHGFRGDIVGGWFGGKYAEVKGQAAIDLDTSVMATVALNLLVAEGGLRGGLTLKGGLKGETVGCLSFGEDGVHLDSFSVHVEGQAELGAAAELYLETLLSDEQTWELGALPLGVATGFALDLSWDDSGFSGIEGSLGSGFEMSPELHALIEDMRAKVGV